MKFIKRFTPTAVLGLLIYAWIQIHYGPEGLSDAETNAYFFGFIAGLALDGARAIGKIWSGVDW